MAENNDLNAEFAENPQNRPSDGDLISRQAALNMKFSEGYNNDGVIFVPLRDVTEWIKNLPPVQPEIIRCRDCEFWAKQPDSLQGRCSLSGTYPTGAWYYGNARKGGKSE